MYSLPLIFILPVRGRAAPARGGAAPARVISPSIFLAHLPAVIHLLFTSLSIPALKKLSTIVFRCNFISNFFRTRPLHHQKTGQQKNCQSEQELDQVFNSAMDGRQFQNKDHGDIVPKKRATCAYVLFRSILKKRSRRGSVLQAPGGLPEQN